MTTQLEDSRVGRPVDDDPFLGSGGWTPAHSEAALFVGECVAVGTVLGAFTELTRLLWEQRRG